MAAGKSADVIDLFRTSKVAVGKIEYSVRELSVKENDLCVLAARQPDGSIDGRIMMRMMVLKSIVEPSLTDTELGELPQRLYLRLCDAVTDLNAEDVEEDEDPKND